MKSTLRVVHLLAFVFMVSIGLAGCEDAGRGDSQGVPSGGKCAVEKDCKLGLSCVDEVCVEKPGGDGDVGPDDGDSGTNNGDSDSGNDDAGNGGDGDADTGPVEPECPVEVSCAAEGMECGQIPNGCGGIKSCGTCGEGQYCGEGLDHGKCIDIACVPNANACADAGMQCGAASDGCGGSVECGTCSGGAICGNGATRGQCIVPETCTPKTSCAGTRFECGPMPDGCGGFVQCGGCGAGDSCKAGICEAPVCVPKTAADFANMACGVFADGCGGFVDSGKTCGAGKVCGKGADRGKCVDPVCVPLTAADYQGIANCGAVSDGCNGTINLGNGCAAPDICGGSGIANRCGSDNRGGDCENFCQNQAVCAGGAGTTIKGTVYAPNGTLPLPNAVVYVPNIPLAQLPGIADDGASCERCDDIDYGKPLVGATSNKLGQFEIKHVPANVEFPLVIRVGKWRRVVMIPPRTACGTTTLTAEQTRLPKRHKVESVHDNIPKVAVATGSVDAMECVLRKIGVADTEFTQHTQTGRVHLYRSNGGVASGVTGCGSCDDSNPNSTACTNNNNACRNNLASNLYSNAAKLESYDMVVSDCEANDRKSWRTDQDRTRMLNYVNKGGRFFASHYSYAWLENTDELKTTANWGGGTSGSSTLAFVETGFPRGMDFWDWLVEVQATHSLNPKQVEIKQPRGYVTSVKNGSVSWVTTKAGQTGHVNANTVQQYSFDTPVNAPAADKCGRVVYSGFHVDEVSTSDAKQFPSYCKAGELTAQEKILAFMIFDLGQCITEDGGPPPEPVCIPRDCNDIGAECGAAGDGCGGVIQCGTCPAGRACGVDAPPNQCGGVCRPISCEEHGANCGTISDGCGKTLNCGTCPNGQSCGAGGQVNVCGCEPLSCDDHGAQCGTVSNGCGGTLECGNCGEGQTCSKVGGVNQCIGDCAPLSCDDHGASCGKVSNGCGGTINCGSCQAPESCGGGGVRNECGAQCEPLSCADHGAQCGPVSDGCGGTLECGDCPYLEVCNNMQCEMPACKPTGTSCVDDRQCCGQVCAMGSGGTGICAAN